MAALTRQRLAWSKPPYDPSLVNDRQFHENIYSRFGYDPYWAGGYRYPNLYYPL